MTPGAVLRFSFTLVLLLGGQQIAICQSFGSSGDPMEQPRILQRAPFAVGSAFAGPAYVGDTWSGALSARIHAGVNAWSIGLSGTLHSNPEELHHRETDEAEDLARIVEYLRHDATQAFPVYARIGPIKGMDLGRGHLVKDYRTTTAWDDRSVGAEFAYSSSMLDFGAFSSDLDLDGVLGASTELRPAWRSSSALSTLTIGGGIVHDRAFQVNDTPTAFQVEGSIDVEEYFEFAVTPFLSYARFLNYGNSFGGGIEVGTDNLIDAADVVARAGLYFSGDGFAPGFFGPYYGVSTGSNRIVTADSFFDDVTGTELLGLSLADVTQGTDLVTEFDIVIFGSFQASYYFRRHYGDQALSYFAFRVASRPRFFDGLRVELSMERTGLTDFFSIFSDLKDQNSLLFQIDYPLGNSLHASIRSRYGYRRLPAEQPGFSGSDVQETKRYLVERRFEPLFGVRYQF